MGVPKGKRDFRDLDRLDALRASRGRVFHEALGRDQGPDHRKVGHSVKDIAAEFGKKR
jgi:hypothetical protein